MLIYGLLNLVSGAAAATNALSSIGVTTGAGAAGTTLSLPMQIALGMTLLSVLPAVMMCITPFLRIVIVLHFLRQALGHIQPPRIKYLWDCLFSFHYSLFSR